MSLEPSGPSNDPPLMQALDTNFRWGNLQGSTCVLTCVLGHETRMAHDGLAAVESAENFRPEIILLDIGLPHLNGYDACRRIREKSWSEGIKIVAVTGWGQEEDRRLSNEAGFNLHLVKPIELASIEQLLKDATKAS